MSDNRVTRLYDGDTFEHEGHTFRFQCKHDEDMQEPWKEHDGHGIISDWTHRDKRAGERVLVQDRYGRAKQYYDIAATIQQATKDGWGISEKSEQELETRLGRKPTKREIIAESVEQDYQRMRAWCHDEWHWCGVVVTMIEDINGDAVENIDASVWGIDGDDQTEYLTETAYELADECIAQWQEYGATVNE